MLLFHENLCANIECPHVHANLLLNFMIFQNVFSNNRFICTCEPNWIFERKDKSLNIITNLCLLILPTPSEF
jgi:hypothetical protein